MRNLTEAILYPGIGLLESALSVGRGTDSPFELVGAPYINERQLAEAMNSAGLPGVRFVPVQFTPSASIHQGLLCQGVRILLTERDRCNVVDVGTVLAQTLVRLYPDKFPLEKIERLLLAPSTLSAIQSNVPLQAMHAEWDKDLKTFTAVRAKYLLY
jgi:uncharacterized protein YbbC (DUF1343 family)